MNAPLSPKQIEYWPLAQLKPYARNAKTHDANHVAKIAASMADFGWTVPVLVAADGELIAGHDRSATCIDNLRWESLQAERHRSLRAARPRKSH